MWQSLLIFWASLTAFIGTNRAVAPSSIGQTCSKILINLTIKISLDNFIKWHLDANEVLHALFQSIYRTSKTKKMR